MITKIEAAKICMNTGCNMIISNGLKNNPIKRINKFKNLHGSCQNNQSQLKEKWILSSINTKGAIKLMMAQEKLCYLEKVYCL